MIELLEFLIARIARIAGIAKVFFALGCEISQNIYIGGT